jgi:hypothetical protein
MFIVVVTDAYYVNIAWDYLSLVFQSGQKG